MTEPTREMTLAEFEEGGEPPRELMVSFRRLVKEFPSTTYATFGLCRYPAKFIPHVVGYALKRYAAQGASVFDPFAGYGTVGTVARLYGNPYELWDLNPLLEYLHATSVMEPVQTDGKDLLHALTTWEEPFTPDWPNLGYWHPEEFVPMLSRAWGFYHGLDDEELRRFLLVPLIRATRHFSYNDERRQKLSRSPVSERRVGGLLSEDWRGLFFRRVAKGLIELRERLREYWSLKPRTVHSRVRGGVDTLEAELSETHDVLLTSPPYMQAQEYIRATKMDLYWLGHPDDEIRGLGRKEIPYRDVPRVPILSSTYEEYLDTLDEAPVRRLFQRYFHAVLGSLSRVQERIRSRLLLFVGPANVRARPVPLSRIFAEHFSALGWRHEETLVDTIVARGMFDYGANPATGLRDERMRSEHLLVLARS